MKITTISDTHSSYNRLWIQETDILIHSGDIDCQYSTQEFISFINWFRKQPAKYKILVAGNHDCWFEDHYNFVAQYCDEFNIIYLENSGCEIEGLKFWGSPYTPMFMNWAFMRNRGKDMFEIWKNIPKNLDVLITHGPPFGILDKNLENDCVGCEELLKKVKEVEPKYHLFGHIHGSQGILKKEKTTFINASVMNEDYVVVNQPVSITI
jgi:Icc-related predicted phosphoesterase